MNEFRSAPSQGEQQQQAPRGQREGDITSPLTNTEVPLSRYEDIYNIPYGAKFFEVNGYRGLNSITDVEGVKDDIRTVDEYVFRKIVDGNLYDTQETYKSILDGLFEKIGVDKNEQMSSRLAKVARYIELISRDKNFEERKRELIKRQTQAERKLNYLKLRLGNINEKLKQYE